MPPISHLKETTLAGIQQFVSQSGNVLGETLLPTKGIQTSDEMIAKNIFALFGIDPIAIRQAFLAGSDQEYRLHTFSYGQGNAVFLSGPGLYHAKPQELLEEAILKCITPEIKISSQDVFYLHRVKDAQDFYFFVNTADSACSLTIAIQKEGTPQIWNLESGSITDLLLYQFHDGWTSFDISLPPIGSTMISFVAPKRNHATKSNVALTSFQENIAEGIGRISADASLEVDYGGTTRSWRIPAKQPAPEVPLTGPWSFTLQHDNALLLSKWKFQLDELQEGCKLHYHENDFDDHQWLDYQMGAWEMQLPEERDEKQYPVDIWYRTAFWIDALPPRLVVMIDGFKCLSYDLYFNGQRLSGSKRRSHLDSQIAEMDISSYVHTGKNQVALRMTVTNKSQGLLDLMKIVGNFSLEPSGESTYAIAAPKPIIKLGSWTTQGYPYYSGCGTYTTTLSVPENFKEWRWILEWDCGSDVAHLSLNGIEIGSRIWKPYSMDLTDYLVCGENKLGISVTNTMINLLEGAKQPSGLFSARLIPYDIYQFQLDNK